MEGVSSRITKQIFTFSRFSKTGVARKVKDVTLVPFCKTEFIGEHSKSREKTRLCLVVPKHFSCVLLRQGVLYHCLETRAMLFYSLKIFFFCVIFHLLPVSFKVQL